MTPLGNAHEHGMFGDEAHGLTPGQMAAIKAKLAATGGIMGGVVRPMYGKGTKPVMGTGTVRVKSTPMRAPSLSRAGQTPPSARPGKLAAPSAEHVSQAKGKTQSLPSFAMGGSKVKAPAPKAAKPSGAKAHSPGGHKGGHSPLSELAHKVKHAGQHVSNAAKGAVREVGEAAHLGAHATINATGTHAPTQALSPKGHGLDGGVSHVGQHGFLRHRLCTGSGTTISRCTLTPSGTAGGEGRASSR